jgi:hypothetical protein
MSKYRNKKVKIGDLKFDSQIEYKYYNQLVWLKRNKQIKDFELQPPFILLDKFKTAEGKTIRAIKYIADFKVINLDGSFEIVDVKGKLTEVFKLKKKMFQSRYPDIKLRCVYWDEYKGWYELD